MSALTGLLLTCLVMFMLGYGLGVANTSRHHQAERRILDELACGGAQFALDISRRSGVGIGRVYVHLARLEQEGRVSSGLENIDPAAEGRPQRRYYRLRSEI